MALSLTGATTLCDLVARMSVAQSGEGVSLTPVLAASKSPVAQSLTGATELCDLVARMSVAQSGKAGWHIADTGAGGFKIPGGAVAYRGYSAMRFGSQDERSAIREAGWHIADTGAGGFKIPGGAVAYRGYSAVRFGSPDERSAIREGRVAYR